LPLTIHRQLTLLRQLDNQAYGYSSDLLPTIRQYIELRQEIVNTRYLTQVEDKTWNLSPQAIAPQEDCTSTAVPTRTQSVPSPRAAQMKEDVPAASADMLSHIAWLSEEYLRTSREKVSIAQTVHDSVDRHIRLLDQFIKEQEASLGPEPNVPVMLSMSELFVPKWSRSTRVSMSPMLDEGDDVVVQSQPVQLEAFMPSERSNRRRPPKNRKQKEKDKEKEREKEESSAAPPLRITLPPPHQEIHPDPNEPTWCYCNRVSFGEMIGCDDPECKYEWFHLECVGLKAVPEDDEWYCQECAQRQVRNRRR